MFAYKSVIIWRGLALRMHTASSAYSNICYQSLKRKCVFRLRIAARKSSIGVKLSVFLFAVPAHPQPKLVADRKWAFNISQRPLWTQRSKESKLKCPLTTCRLPTCMIAQKKFRFLQWQRYYCYYKGTSWSVYSDVLILRFSTIIRLKMRAFARLLSIRSDYGNEHFSSS